MLSVLKYRYQKYKQPIRSWHYQEVYSYANYNLKNKGASSFICEYIS